MESPATRDVLVFPAQGSSQYLSDRDALDSLLANLGGRRHLYETFVKRCRDELVTEFQTLDDEERSAFGDDFLASFPEPLSLLLPPQSVHSHPIAQTLALYLRQILELVLYGYYGGENRVVVEVSGVCTGQLPAVLAGSFSTYASEEFIRSATELFRVAFWIGVRASIFCWKIAGASWRELPWVLSVFGLSVDEVEEKLSKYAKAQDATPALGFQPRVSAIFDNSVSISGPGSTLTKLRAAELPSVQCRAAQIHACYHGGSAMQDVMKQVQHDVERRHIVFPPWDSLQAPLRSSLTGRRMSSQYESQSLLDSILASIFVDKVYWPRVHTAISDHLNQTRRRDPHVRYRILGLGPGADSLVSRLKQEPLGPRISITSNISDFINGINELSGVAVVGISANFPSGKGVQQLWETLEQGKSAASEIPATRFDVSQYYEQDGQGTSKSRKLSTKYGNFLEDPFEFDPSYFNISPREAKSIDPQQRLLLQASLDALEDAGYAPDSTSSFQRDTFGVYIGAATGDYVDNLRDDIDVYYSPGRISYVHQFKGPSMVFDTACSSSAVAIHQACKALLSGDCNAALAGGVNTISSPDMYLGLSRAHFLSSTGQCKPFDAGADGYCRGEGCGLVVLKRLSQAIEEGDHIYGVIRGTGLNQCGTSKSITHPDAETQAALFNDVLCSAKVSPDSISVVEAHGTGTQAGDYAETLSLRSTFGPRPASNPLYLSSIKGNIGHAEAASGVAGLIKILLMMQKKTIPPQASHKSLNPALADNLSGGYVVPTLATAWEGTSSRIPRRALLNNFGAAGSNAALILEEYMTGQPAKGISRKQPSPEPSYHILNLSAKSEQSLETLRRAYLAHMTSNSTKSSLGLCFSTNARRINHPSYRLSVTGADSTELLGKLGTAPVVRRNTHGAAQKNVIFAFPGQGCIYRGMGSELLAKSDVFRQSVRECDDILTRNGFTATEFFMSQSEGVELDLQSGNGIVVAQSACFVVEYALAKLWISWGVKPNVVLGHSIGEYAAFVIAGCLSLEEAIVFVATRARMLAATCGPGTSGMVSCRLSEAEATEIMKNSSPDISELSIACYNSNEDVVVAGPSAALNRFIEACKGKKVKHKRLEVPLGFHSPAMDPVLEEIRACAASLNMMPPIMKFGSSHYGRVVQPGEELSSDYLAGHTREPVKFSNLIRSISGDLPEVGVTVLEVGPSVTIEPMFRRTTGEPSYTHLSSMRASRTPWTTLATSLQTLWLDGFAIDWRAVYSGFGSKFDNALPRYPLNGTKYCVPFREYSRPDSKAVKLEPAPQPAFEFLKHAGIRIPGTSSPTSAVTSITQISPHIKAHAVGGVPLCPASVYMEIALEALMAAEEPGLNTGKQIFEFDNLQFDKPLVYSESSKDFSQSDVRTELNAQTNGAFGVATYSKERQTHFSCRLTRKSPGCLSETMLRRRAFVHRQLSSFNPAQISPPAETLSARTIYDIVFPRVVDYGEPFTTLKSLTVSNSGLEGRGVFQLNQLALQGRFVCPPAFIDTPLHTAGFLANLSVTSDIACICVQVDHAIMPHAEPDSLSGEMEVYCSLIDVGHSIIADAYVIGGPTRDVVAMVEGMAFKKLQLKSFRAHLGRLAKPATAPVFRARGAPAVTVPATAPRGIPAKPAEPNSALEDVVGTVTSILSQVCGIEGHATGPLPELGVDSLLFIELVESILARFPNSMVSKSALENCSTVEMLVSTVAQGLETSGIAASPDLPDELSPPPLTMTNSPAGPTPGAMTPVSITAGQSSELELLVGDICGLTLSDDQKEQPLSSLGVDSLLSIELGTQLRAQFSEQFSASLANDNDDISSLTYRQLEALLQPKGIGKADHAPQIAQPVPRAVGSHTTQAGSTTFPKPLQVQSYGPPKTSLWLFHDGSGLCNMYGRLSDINRNVHGIHSALLQDRPFERMQDLAQFYVEAGNLSSRKEVILGGWSFGGVLAFEVSRQLRKLGVNVIGVVLIDSPAPVDHKQLPPDVISHVIKKSEKGNATTSEAVKRARHDIEANFRRHAAMLEGYNPGKDAGGGVPCVMLKCTRVFDTENLCGVSYPWLSDASFRDQSIAQWEEVFGRQIPVLDIDCDHFDVFTHTKTLEDVSNKLKVACEMLESGHLSV
ncbi:hypothetical protein DL765_001488 [Monosporascus sp. GIB2]|nr:hypothetical protein DL765_001488 [Monosporascus sp. GIB2]